MPERRCSTPGCSKPHRARGLCSTHYNRRNPSIVVTECAVCGCDVIKHKQQVERTRRVVCSYNCRRFLQHPMSCAVPGTHLSRSTPVPLSHPSRAPIYCDVPSSHPSRAPRRVFTAGQCADCGAPFIVVNRWDTQSRYCSKRCLNRVGRRTRRARECGATGSWTWDSFAKLTMRLGSRCAYCGTDNDGQPFDPDHVVPLSRGGHNGLTNLLPACRSCNCDKRDLLVHEWAADRENRGLPHVRYDVDRFMHLTAHQHAFAA